MSPVLRRGLIGFIAVLIVLLGAFAYEQFFIAQAPTDQAGLAIGGPFTLIDQNGVVRHDSDFRGKLMLVYFGYTFCPDICPTTLDTMSRALAKLGDQAGGVVPIFITVDPARDTVAQLKAYAANFDPRLVALTGAPAQIDAVAKEYRVYFRKAAGEGSEYSVDHSSVIYLMGRDGRYAGHFDPGVTADSMAGTLRNHL